MELEEQALEVLRAGGDAEAPGNAVRAAIARFNASGGALVSRPSFAERENV